MKLKKKAVEKIIEKLVQQQELWKCIIMEFLMMINLYNYSKD